MGISGAFEILGDGEIVSLAELSDEYYRRHGRPLRVAVDEAGWRFSNLTDQQVAIIRKKEPAANPIEKAILYRILKLLKLNIHLLFIFDGNRRPWKRGRAAGRIDWKRIRLLKQLLTHLGVPFHTAPAEAEAECASLQQEGVVDAVWSEDSDSLMFGATLLIRDYRPKKGTKAKSDTHVRLYRSETILREKGIDRAGWVLFAMLSGGDYDAMGVRGCGANTASRAAHHRLGLGKLLWETPESRLHIVRDEIVVFLRNKDVDVPFDWPRALPVGHYKNPLVSDRHTLTHLHKLSKGWDPGFPIEHDKLRVMMRDNFHFWTKGYMKLIGPVLITNILRENDRGKTGSKSDPPFGIKLVWPKRKKAQAQALTAEDAATPADTAIPDDPSSLERKITFLPCKELTSFDHTVQPDGEDWAQLETKTHGKYDPMAPVECEIMECLLRRHLPDSAFEPPAPGTAPHPPGESRSNDDGDDAVDGTAPKHPRPRKRKQPSAAATEDAELREALKASATADGLVPNQPRPRKRKQPNAATAGDTELQEARGASTVWSRRPEPKATTATVETPVFKFPEGFGSRESVTSTQAENGPVAQTMTPTAAYSRSSAGSNALAARPQPWALPPPDDAWEVDESMERMNDEIDANGDLTREEDDIEIMWAGQRLNSRPSAAPSSSRPGTAPVLGHVGSQSSTSRSSALSSGHTTAPGRVTAGSQSSTPRPSASLSENGTVLKRVNPGLQSSTPRPLEPSSGYGGVADRNLTLPQSSNARPSATLSGFGAVPNGSSEGQKKTDIIDLLSDSEDEDTRPASTKPMQLNGSALRPASQATPPRPAPPTPAASTADMTTSNPLPPPSRACASTLDRLLANTRNTHEQEARPTQTQDDNQPVILNPSRKTCSPHSNARGATEQPARSAHLREHDGPLVVSPPRPTRFLRSPAKSSADVNRYRAHQTQIADDEEPLVLTPPRPNRQLQPQLDDEPLFCTPPPVARDASTDFDDNRDDIFGTRPPAARPSRPTTLVPAAAPVAARSPARTSTSSVRRPPQIPVASRSPGRTSDLSVRIADASGGASATVASSAQFDGVEVVDLTSD